MQPRLFERIVDLEGRLRLPDSLFDEYGSCYISLGLFSNTYLQLTPEGVYLLIDEQITGPFTDKESFRLQRNFHTGTHLKLDSVGRITIPLNLLRRAGITPGYAVVGEAGVNDKPGHPAYWTLEDKAQWSERNPLGLYALDTL